MSNKLQKSVVSRLTGIGGRYSRCGVTFVSVHRQGPQEGFANGIEFGPCNRKAELRGRAAERVTPHDKLMRLDWRKIEPQMNAISERWQREIVV